MDRLSQRVVPETFVKSSRFNGNKCGMVFKMGPHDLGYYRDQRVIELAPILRLTQNVTPLVFELDALVRNILPSRAADATERMVDG